MQIFGSEPEAYKRAGEVKKAHGVWPAVRPVPGGFQLAFDPEDNPDLPAGAVEPTYGAMIRRSEGDDPLVQQPSGRLK
jgi:hypothetical protein